MDQSYDLTPEGVYLEELRLIIDEQRRSDVKFTKIFHGRLQTLFDGFVKNVSESVADVKKVEQWRYDQYRNMGCSRVGVDFSHSPEDSERHCDGMLAKCVAFQCKYTLEEWNPKYDCKPCETLGSQPRSGHTLHQKSPEQRDIDNYSQHVQESLAAFSQMQQNAQVRYENSRRAGEENLQAELSRFQVHKASIASVQEFAKQFNSIARQMQNAEAEALMAKMKSESARIIDHGRSVLDRLDVHAAHDSGVDNNALKEHHSECDCWIRMEDKIYDVSYLCKHHPQGVIQCGQTNDLYDEYTAIGHGGEPKRLVGNWNPENVGAAAGASDDAVFPAEENQKGLNNGISLAMTAGKAASVVEVQYPDP